MKPRISIILGTRPEIVKLAPVVRACERRDVPYSVVHTGQHYSDTLDDVFFDQLDLPEPEYRLGVGSESHGEQTGKMIEGVERVLLEEEPDAVLVQGDTNSTLAGAIAASKLDPTLGHVEAGLRSFNREMPEEVNRTMVDHVSDVLFAPTEAARSNLVTESIPLDRIEVTGNTVVDAVQQNRRLAAEKSDVLDRYGLSPDSFALMTAHRPSTVDDDERFADVLEGVSAVGRELDLDVVYPVHPRAESSLEAFDLPVPDRIRLVDAQSYLDFLRLQDTAALVLTDSGGVQEEACTLSVPCVTFREDTERTETVEVGANRLVGTDPEAILDGAVEMVDADGDWQNPFGDGTAAERILDSPAVGSESQEVVQ